MKNLNLKNLTLMMLLFCSSLSFSQNWLTNGNAAGVNNFLGTTNGTSLTIKTSNTTRMTILHTTGNVGIGTTTPSVQFHTTGAVRFQGLIQNAGNNNFVVADASGNLAVRDINTIIFNNTWNTTGNNTGGFIGTNNNFALPIRTNNLERLRITETGLVGIGTTTPSAQFHTTATVRFQGLALSASAPRYVVSDASGNIAYKDVAASNDFWKPTGNAATTGNFIGTTNSFELPFRTNNIERLRITQTGNIGIGTTSPSAQLHTTGSVRLQGLVSTPLFDVTSSVMTVDIAGNVQKTTASNIIGDNAWKVGGNDLMSAIPPNISTLGSNAVNGVPVALKSNDRIGLVVNNGKVVIGDLPTNLCLPCFNTPTAQLHVICQSTVNTGVRFENLPMAPTGTVLVQDPVGNVFNSGIDVTTLVNLVQNKNEESLRIAALEKELQELKSLLKKSNPTSVAPAPTKATLYQNYPNPTGSFTNIRLFVEENNATVQCNIYDLNNTLVQSHAIKGNGEQVLAVDTQSLSSAVYFYTLEIDGKIIDSKKLIIQK